MHEVLVDCLVKVAHENVWLRGSFFYIRRIGLYLYKYRIYGTISIYILKGLAFAYQLI